MKSTGMQTAVSLSTTMGTKSDTSGNRVFPKKPGHHWSENLLYAMKDPSVIVYEDELTIAIKDKYPKATHHYLVLPKEDIPNLKAVSNKNINLLKHMQKVGEELAEKHKDKRFLLGYHSVPSKIRLHLHVVSDDFDSPCLKTKKHWNSFTTPFFVENEKVINDLETKGEISHISLRDSKNFISKPLKCHKCDYTPKHMPDLKNHLKTHLS